jgi:predicted amidohydrolase
MRRITLCVTAVMALATGGLSQEKSGDRKADRLRMALVNLKSVFSDGPDAAANQKNLKINLDRHLFFIDKAAALGAEFVGFPELSLNGYRFSKDMTWLRLDGPEVQALAKKAVEKKVYVSAGIAEQAADGKRWNTQFVLGPDGKVIGWHHKIWLTAEKGHVEVGSTHNVFEVKGEKMGISICADGSNRDNLKALVGNGARIIYGPHANTTGSTIAGWYNFRKAWGGPQGWIAEFKVHAALHNHAALYNPDFNPPVASDGSTRWASGAWFIGPDGATLAQMPTSTDKADSKEYVLIHDVPLSTRP